jgi:hypothetical protein
VTILAGIRPANWRPVQAGGRTLIVSCVGCRRGAVNETNALRRAGWRESTDRRRLLICLDCYLGATG